MTATVLALAGVLAAGAPAASSAPALRVCSFAPFSVRGTHFQPSEHVRVTLGSRAAHVMRVHATAHGTFVATFQGVTAQRCDGYFVRALGSKGSVAVLRTHPLACASTNPG